MARKKTKDVDVLEEKKETKKDKVKLTENEKTTDNEITLEKKELKVVDSEELQNDITPIVENTKEEKVSRFWDEVKSFFILVIIIGLVILAGWLFIKYAEPIEWNKKDKNNKDEIKISDTKDYEIISYKSKEKDAYLEVINDKYLIEYSGNYVTKIMDMKLNVLYEAIDEEEYIFGEGKDGNLYAFVSNEIDDGIILNLYVLENKKIVEINEFSKQGVYYTPLYTDNYIIGIVGNYCYLDDNLEDVCETEIYSLDGNNGILNNMYVVGDLSLGSEDGAPIYSRNARYIVVCDALEDKYGLYDLKEHEMIVNTSYDDLYTTYNNSYVAVKDGKVGIIDKKLKKLVDFEYDFIDIHEDYYVVSKNNKLAFMNSEYQLLTGFDFPYVNYTDMTKYNGYIYRQSLMSMNSFVSVKLNDNYLLINKIKEQQGYTYIGENAFLIKDKDNHKEIKIDSFGIEDLLYSYSLKNKKLVVYDEDLNEKITINLKDYDYDDYPNVELVNGNTIVVTMDSELYFDYNTGEEVENIQDVSYIVEDLTLNYSNKTGKVSVLKGKKEIVSYPYDPLYQKKPYMVLENNDFYFVDEDSYVMVVKR